MRATRSAAFVPFEVLLNLPLVVSAVENIAVLCPRPQGDPTNITVHRLSHHNPSVSFRATLDCFGSSTRYFDKTAGPVLVINGKTITDAGDQLYYAADNTRPPARAEDLTKHTGPGCSLGFATDFCTGAQTAQVYTYSTSARE